jgi:hypothetical protein
MEKLLKKFKIGMVALGAMAFMVMAGWQFNSSGTEEVFSDKDVALENAYAGSGSGCHQAMRRCDGVMTAYTCIKDHTAWSCSQFYCYGC